MAYRRPFLHPGSSEPLHQEHGTRSELFTERYRRHQTHGQELFENSRERHSLWPMGAARKCAGNSFALAIDEACRHTR